MGSVEGHVVATVKRTPDVSCICPLVHTFTVSDTQISYEEKFSSVNLSFFF